MSFLLFLSLVFDFCLLGKGFGVELEIEASVLEILISQHWRIRRVVRKQILSLERNYGVQILMVWSQEQVATTLTDLCSACVPFEPLTPPLTVAPSGAAPSVLTLPQAIQVTKWLWASIVFVHRPVLRSQSLIVLSSEAVSRNLPEGAKTMDLTQLLWRRREVREENEIMLRIQDAKIWKELDTHSWPLNVLIHWPLTVSQILTVLSLEPVATNRPWVDFSSFAFEGIPASSLRAG